jgi:hypothetical protein
MRHHDLIGEQVAWVQVGAYTGSTDDGYKDVVWTAPYTCQVKSVVAFPQYKGANLTGGTASDYFTLTTYDGTVAIGTAGISGTISSGGSLSVYSGSREMTDGDTLLLEYGTAGGTAGLNLPRCTVRIKYQGD